MDVDALLDAANAGLKAKGARARIGRMRHTLCLRATLPLKEGGGKRQQRFPIGLPATPQGVFKAEAKALELHVQLVEGSFSWDAWEPKQSEAPEPGPSEKRIDSEDFRQAMRDLHAKNYRGKRQDSAQMTWDKKWKPVLNKLPLLGYVDEETLLHLLRTKTKENSAARRDQGNILANVADSLGIETKRLREIAKGYSSSELQERDIPSDEKILEIHERIKLPHWRWAWMMCATFGLRPHELAAGHWDPEDGRFWQVDDNSKTKAHLAMPVPSQWIDTYNLHALNGLDRPPLTVSKAFNDALDRDAIGITPYNLRHRYAIRCFEKGVLTQDAARSLGHSVVVHERTYKKWLQADQIRKAFDRYQL